MVPAVEPGSVDSNPATRKTSVPGNDAKLARVRRILQRQSNPVWGKAYVPSIRATPAEAPRCSRPTILRPAKLGLRDMHLLSNQEAAAAILALYHPNVWDIHEQHMLNTEPTLHPLANHPTSGHRLPRVEGTIAVAERMGMLPRHGKIYSNELGKWVPDIYVGDLLLFCIDSGGRYCVNWTVKATEDDFHRSGPRLHGKPRKASGEREKFRHELEMKYFCDAEIRTQRIAGDMIDPTLRLNLEHLFRHHAKCVDLIDAVRTEILDAFDAGIGSSTPAFSLVQEQAKRHQASIESVRTLLYQGIWHRRLRLDLFTPFVVDKPMRPEERDPLDVYADWFNR